MQAQDRQHKGHRKSTSVSATILFIALSCLLVYAAVRWAGGTVVRFLSAPETTAVPQQTPTAAQIEANAVSEDRQTSAPKTTVPVHTPQATPFAEPSEVPISTVLDADPSAGEPLRETGAWQQGARYTAAFDRERMDIVLVLSDAEGMTAAVCAVAVRGTEVSLLAIPANCVTEDGVLLQSRSAKSITKVLSRLLPVDYDQYIVLPAAIWKDAVDAVGTLQVAGRSMDGTAVEAYFAESSDAPLLLAERFSHVLSALPERIRSLSLLKLIRLKSELEDAVATNIDVEDGWMLCNALREIASDAIAEYTLPAESVFVSAGRAYRPHIGLTESLLQKIYGSS